MKLRRALRYLTPFIFVVLWPLQVAAQDHPTPLRDMPVPPPEKRYPVKYDEQSLKEAYSKPGQWEGRAISIAGTVRSVKRNAWGQPAIEIVVGNTTLWATWPLVEPTDMRGLLKVGTELRALGWMRESVEWAKITNLNLPRQNSLTLVPISLIRMREFGAVCDRKYLEYCQAWAKGLMPENLAR